MSQNEAAEQEALFTWIEYVKGKYPNLKWTFHIPNGGSRNTIEAASLKRQGVRKGVPDIFFPYPSGQYHGLFIEMKFGKNKPTKEQVDYINYLNSVGYMAVVCYGCEQAIKVIKKYLEC